MFLPLCSVSMFLSSSFKPHPCYTYFIVIRVLYNEYIIKCRDENHIENVHFEVEAMSIYIYISGNGILTHLILRRCVLS